MGFNLEDYVDVAERIRLFYEQYPEGSFQTLEWKVLEAVGTGKDGKEVRKTFITYHAAAYRHPGDQMPAHGIAWEVFPGSTPYTRDSELMNAETSAWGRAAVAAGLSTKKIASMEEVRNRHAESGHVETLSSSAASVEDYATRVRTTGMKADALKAWLKTEGGCGPEVNALRGQEFAEFLNALETGVQASLLDWAKGDK